MTDLFCFVTLEHLKTEHNDYLVPKVWPVIKKLVFTKSTDRLEWPTLTHLQKQTKTKIVILNSSCISFSHLRSTIRPAGALCFCESQGRQGP